MLPLAARRTRVRLPAIMWLAALTSSFPYCIHPQSFTIPSLWGYHVASRKASGCRFVAPVFELYSSKDDELGDGVGATGRFAQNGPLSNPRLPVLNEYLAGWALTQNNTNCLNGLLGMGYYTLPELSDRSLTGSPDISALSEETPLRVGGDLWGEATRALLHRLDVVHDRDQRRLAASRYWQLLQENSGIFASSSTDGSISPSWEDVHALFEYDPDFVRRERKRFMEEAAGLMPEGWRDDDVARAWVASYRLSIFETRRQAQRFFSWAIPYERALDCLLEPGKRVVEVGSGLGYWAHLLKMRCGDDNRVRCFDPYASTPYPKTREVGIGPQDPEGSDESEGVIEADDDDSDVWFGEGRSPFVPVERGSSERIAGDPNGFRDWSLFICWPSDGRWPRDCIHAFQGDDFFYVGEEEGGATRMPWRVLREEWQLERKVDIPRWPGFKDALWWYRRRGAAPLPPNR